MEKDDSILGSANTKGIQAYIYKLLSLFPHNSYYSMLESIDIFKKDYNFNSISSVHFTKSNLRYGNTVMVDTLVTMKAIFKNLNDQETCTQLNLLIGNQKIDEKKIAELQQRFPKTILH